jgi:hypothetical protein
MDAGDYLLAVVFGVLASLALLSIVPRPVRTAEDVYREIVAGLNDGSIVLANEDEE